MTRRRVLGILVALLLLPALGHAFMPAAIEQAVRSWFNSVGKLMGFTIYSSSSTPALSPADGCRLYVTSTGSLMASCDGAAYSYLVSNATNACAQDASGNLTCNTVSTADQGPVTANAMRVLANATPQPCSAAGVWGKLTLTQTTPGGSYCWCNGQQLLSCIAGTPIPTPTATP